MILDHIAYAVKSTNESISAFSVVYPEVVLYKEPEPGQNVLITHLSNNSDAYKLELVEPLNSPNPVEQSLRSRACVLHHLCYSVDDLRDGIITLKQKGYLLVTQPFKTCITKGKWACHFFHPHSGIIEVIGNYGE